METLEEKRVEYVYDDVELNKLVKEFLSEAKDFIDEGDYHLNEKSAEALKQMKGIVWKSYFQNCSKRMKKKTNNYIGRFREKKSLRNANRMFHFIHTRVLAKQEEVKVEYSWTTYFYKKWTNPDFIEKVKIESPLKHQAIQEKRKKWLEAREISDKLLSEYKEEKGDYYKNK